MNRNIKFRAWDDKNKQWLLNYKELGGFSLFGESMLFGEWSDILSQHMASIDAIKVMQYTGLKDKNGKEIYEGDIIKIYEEGREDEDPLIRTVEWSTESAGYFVYDYDGADFNPALGSDMFTLEIIGNIYENADN